MAMLRMIWEVLGVMAQASTGALRRLASTAFKDKPAKIVMADAQGHPSVGSLQDEIANAPNADTAARAG
jgi:hypothetical protein